MQLDVVLRSHYAYGNGVSQDYQKALEQYWSQLIPLPRGIS